jgi:hypothetical protein
MAGGLALLLGVLADHLGVGLALVSLSLLIAALFPWLKVEEAAAKEA